MKSKQEEKVLTKIFRNKDKFNLAKEMLIELAIRSEGIEDNPNVESDSQLAVFAHNYIKAFEKVYGLTPIK